MSKNKASELRTLRANALAFIKKHGGIEAAADAILSSPGRQQKHADMRELHWQGIEFDEDAMQCLDYTSIDVELIVIGEAEEPPALPKLGGRIGLICKLADLGWSAQQIADQLGLTRRRVNQILRDKNGKLRGAIKVVQLQLELPL